MPLLGGAIMLSAVTVVSPDVVRMSPLGGETFLFGRYKGQPVSEVENKHPEYIRQLKGQPGFARNFPKLIARLEQHTPAPASVGIGSPVSPAHGQGKAFASPGQEQPASSSVEIESPISPASADVDCPVSSARGEGELFASLDKEQPAPVSVEIGPAISPASVGIGSPVSPCHGEGTLPTSLKPEQLAAPSIEVGSSIPPASAEVGSPVSATSRDGDRDEICWWGKHKGLLVSVIHKIDPYFFERSLKYHPEVAIKDRLYFDFLERNKSPPILPNQRNISDWTKPIFHGRHWSEPATPQSAPRSNATRTVEDNTLPQGTSPAPKNSKAKRTRKNVLAAATSPRSPPLRQRSPATSRPAPRARKPASPRARKNPPRAHPSASQHPSAIAQLRLQGGATKQRTTHAFHAGLTH